MATNPRTWIYKLIDLVPGFLSTPARWIADRIMGVLDDGVEFARWLKSGFDYLRAKGDAFAARVRLLANEAYTTLKWLIDIRIPALINNAIAVLRRWVTATINTVSSTLRALISTLDRWARNAVATLIDKLNAVRDWLIAKINGVIEKLRRTVDVWYERLTDPKKFAAWLAGAMLLALLNYAYANRDKIANWLLRSSPAFTAWLARELESVLRRLL